MRLRSIGVLTVANGANALLAFTTSVIAARALRPEEFGRLSVLMATSVFLVLSLDFGMNQLLTARVARGKSAGLFRDILRLRTSLALLATLGAFALAGVALQAHGGALATQPAQWGLVVSSALWQLVFTSDQALAQGRQEFRRLAGQIAAVNGVRVGVVAAVAATSPRYEHVLAAFVMASGVTGLHTAYRHRDCLIGRANGFRVLRALLPVVVLAGVSVGLTAMLSRIGIWAVALISGHAAAGAYAVAFQMASLVLAFASALSLSFLPHVAQLDRDGKAHEFFRSYLRKAVPATIAMVILAGALAATVPHIFGARYAGTGPTTFLLMVGFVVSALNSPFYLLQVSRLRYAFLIKVHAAQVCLLAAGCLLLVPRFSGEGAAVAEVVMRVLVGSLFIVRVLRETRSEARAQGQALGWAPRQAGP